MSYCCGTCRNLDQHDLFPVLDALLAHYKWSGFANILKGLAEDPDVQASYGQLIIERAIEHARIEAIREAEIQRRAAKRQKNATRRMFRPPYADNLVCERLPDYNPDDVEPGTIG